MYQEGQKSLLISSQFQEPCTIDVVGEFFNLTKINCYLFPGGSDGKESTCNAGDPGSIPCYEKQAWEQLRTRMALLSSQPWYLGYSPPLPQLTASPLSLVPPEQLEIGV